MFLLVVLIFAGTLVRSSNSMAINSSELVTPLAGGNFKDCFSSAGLVECFKSVAVQTLNRAIESNAAIQVTRYLVIKKNPNYQPAAIEERTPHISWATVLSRVRDFISSRTFQLSLTTPDGRSSLLPELSSEGRGKKHKHKHQGGMYMMGGVAFMAMVAQLVLGKVALLAAMALIMAKIALVFSTLNGFKKVASGGGGGGGDHHGYVYEHGGSGGGGGGAGWQRSIEPKRHGTTTGAGDGPDYYDDQAAPYRRRRPDIDYRDPLDGA